MHPVISFMKLQSGRVEVPMFRGVKGHIPEGPATLQFWMANIGLLGMFLGFLLGSTRWLTIFGIIFALSAFLFAFVLAKGYTNVKTMLMGKGGSR